MHGTTSFNYYGVNNLYHWVDKILTDPATFKRLNELDPDATKKSRMHQVMVAISDAPPTAEFYAKGPRNILPPFFYALYNMLATGSALYLQPLLPSGEMSSSFIMSTEDLRDRWVFQTRDLGSWGISINKLYPNPNEEQNKGFFVEPIYQDPQPKLIGGNYHLKKAQRLIQDPTLSSIYAGDEHPLTPNPFVARKFENENIVLSAKAKNPQRDNALRNILSESQNQVKAALSYIMDNPSELADVEFQTFFGQIFFAGDLLQKELQQPSADIFLGKLVALIASQVSIYQELGKVEELSYILHLSELIKSYASRIRPLNDFETSSVFQSAFTETLGSLSQKLAQASKPVFLDSRVIIRNLLSRTGLTEQALSLLSQEMVLSYRVQKNLSPDAMHEFLSASLYLKMHPVSPPYDSIQKDLEVDWTINVLKNEIHAYMNPESRDRNLNALTKQLFNDSETRTWNHEPETLSFISQDGIYRFDLGAQTVSKQSVTQTQIPISKEIAQKAEMVEIFGKNFKAVTTHISTGTLQFQHEGHNYRLIIKEDDFYVQKAFQIDGKQIWFQFTNVAISDLKYYPLIQNLHWISESEPRVMLITDSVNKQSHYRVELTNGNTIKKIHRLIEGRDSGLTLTDIQGPNTPWQFLSNFEPLPHVLVWEDVSKEPKKIELPRFGLTFEVKDVGGQKRAVSNNYAGFFIAEKQYVPVLKDMSHFLLLQNAQGHQKVLLPRRKFYKELTNRFSTALDTLFGKQELHIDSAHAILQHVMVYDLDAKTGQLKPTSDESRLYLAMVYLWKMEYSLDIYEDESGNKRERLALVHNYLRGSESYLRPYKPGESEILDWIATMREENADHDPKALALQLHAVYLILKNHQDFGGPPPSDKVAEIAPKLCEEYQTQLNNIHGVRLEENEILLISRTYPLVKFVPSNNPSESIVVKPLQIDPISTHQNLSGLLEYYRKQVLEKKAAQVTQQHSILRPRLIDHLVEGYALVKGEITDPHQAAEIYKKITTLPSMPLDEQQWKTELASTFEIMRMGALKEKALMERTIIDLLDAVLRAPQVCPSSSDFVEMLKNNDTYFYSRFPPYWEIRSINNPAKTELENKFKRPPAPIMAGPIGPKHNIPTAIGRVTTARQFRLTIPLPFSLNIKAPHQRLPASSKEEISQIIWGEISPPFLGSPVKVNKDLQQVFDVPTNDRVVAKELSRVQASIATAPSKSPWYTLKDIGRFRQLGASNRLKLLSQEQTVRKLENELLVLANKASGSEDLLSKLGEARPDLTIDDLIQLFWHRDSALFQKRNPNLRINLGDPANDDIFQLQNKIAQYLIEKTFAQHLNRLSTHMQAIENAISSKVPETELTELLKQFVVMSTAERAYDPVKYPEYLVLEYYVDILIRPDQVRNLDLLQFHNGKIGNEKALGIIVEMIMGAGKTKVLLALLGLLNADGEHISIGVMPESLLPWAAADLEKGQWGAFKQPVQVISFGRTTPVNVASLQRLQERLEEIRTNRQLLLMSHNSLLSLYLKFIEHWTSYLADPENMSLKKEIDLFRQIFILLKDKGRLVIDEGDTIFNPRSENHFAFGKGLQLPSHEVDLTQTFFEILTTNSEIQRLLNFDFHPSKGTPFSEDFYHQHKDIKPLLIDLILKKQLGSQDPAIQKFFSTLKPEQLSLLRTFIAKTPNQPTTPGYQAAYEFVDKLNIPNLKDLLALAREQIQTFIPLTCSKVSHVHFGVAGNKVFAIPFQGSDAPSLKAEFGSSFETLSYTFQDYLKNKERLITPAVIKAEIEKLQSNALLEIKNDKRKTLQDTDANRQFVQLCGNNPRFSLFEMPGHFDELARYIHKDPKLILHFVRYFAIPSILTFPKLISANPQTLTLLFSSMQAFTGTLENADVLPKGLLAVPAGDITGKTLSLLWNNSRDKIHVIPKIDSKHFARDVIGKNPVVQHANAVIDCGGLAHGISRADISREMLGLQCYTDPNRKSPINAVEFFNENDELMILERGKADPIPIAQSTVPKAERLVFYDQKHTTGADISNIPTAVGLLTISQHTTLRDLKQAVWRLRGLDKSQRIEFVVDSEVKSMIYETLKKLTGKDPGGDLKMEHILLFATFNQAALQGDNNYRSLKQKMLALLQNQIFTILTDPTVDAADAVKLFQATQNYFVQEIITSPWQLFGTETILEKSDKVAEGDLNRLTFSKAFYSLSNHPLITARADPKTTVQTLTQLVTDSKKVLSEMLLTTPGQAGISANEYGKSVEVQIQKETQTAIQKEIDTASGAAVRRIPVLYAGIPADKFFKWSHYNSLTLQDLKKLQNFDVNWNSLPKTWHLNTQEPKPRYYKEQRETLFPMVDVANTFAENMEHDFSKIHRFKDIFDGRLRSTVNVQPIVNSKKEEPTPITYFPFYKWQKPIADVLVVQNNRSGDLRLVFLDEQDSAQLKNIMLENQKTGPSPQGLTDTLSDWIYGDATVNLCLYNFRLGAYLHGKQQITNLNDNPTFLHLIVQAKFFNGETDFSDAELPALKAWITEKGPARMYELFTDYILAYKATSQERFPSSPIGNLFKEFGFKP